MTYYNGARTHLSLNKDAPVPRAVQAIGRILPTPILGGLHHQYVRILGISRRRRLPALRPRPRRRVDGGYREYDASQGLSHAVDADQ
jgi:hypothetical protein